MQARESPICVRSDKLGSASEYIRVTPSTRFVNRLLIFIAICLSWGYYHRLHIWAL